MILQHYLKNQNLKSIIYFANPESSCLVEQDEEPPHEFR